MNIWQNLQDLVKIMSRTYSDLCNLNNGMCSWFQLRQEEDTTINVFQGSSNDFQKNYHLEHTFIPTTASSQSIIRSIA